MFGRSCSEIDGYVVCVRLRGWEGVQVAVEVEVELKP